MAHNDCTAIEQAAEMIAPVHIASAIFIQSETLLFISDFKPRSYWAGFVFFGESKLKRKRSIKRGAWQERQLEEIRRLKRSHSSKLLDMVSFNKFFSSVFLAVVYASSVGAVPLTSSAKHATHRTRSLANNLEIEVFNPPSTYEVRKLATVSQNTKLIIVFIQSDFRHRNYAPTIQARNI